MRRGERENKRSVEDEKVIDLGLMLALLAADLEARGNAEVGRSATLAVAFIAEFRTAASRAS